MQRAVSTLVTVALVLCAVAAPAAAGFAQPDSAPGVEQQQTEDGGVSDENESESGENGSTLTPGEHLVGVVGVQEAEIEGELETRTFGIRVARAATANAKAEVVKSQLDSIEGRLAELRERNQTLHQARENGTISEGRYRAEIAAVAAQTETVKRLVNSSEAEADGLPRELLESKGINATAIQLLKQHASNLTGPEVAQIARSIAGPPTNVPGLGPPADRGPGTGSDGNLTNRTGPPAFVGDGSPADAANRTRGNASGQPSGSSQNATSGEGQGSGPPDGNGPSGEAVPPGNPGKSGLARGHGS